MSSVSTNDDGSTSSVEGAPVMHSRTSLLHSTKKSLSSRKLTRNSSLASNEANRTLRSNNSAQRLSQFKKRISSFTHKKSDSYQKIDNSTRNASQKADTANQSWNTDESSKDDSRSSGRQSEPRRGVRRRRSCDDDFHSMYKAVAAMAIEKRESQELEHLDDEAARTSRRNSDRVANPQSADDRNHFYVPSALSSPDFPYGATGTATATRGRGVPTPSASSSSKSSSTNDLLTRAAAVAGRKQRKQSGPPVRPPFFATSPGSSVDVYTAPLGKKLSSHPPAYASSPHPRSSSSPHLPSKAGVSAGVSSGEKDYKERRRSDPAVDINAFSNKYANKMVSKEGSTPRPTERRRSKRLIPNETVTHQGDNSVAERRRELFRKDFPDDPVPSDAILVRLYGHVNIPPPPPYTSSPASNTHMSEEQASASNGSYSNSSTVTPHGTRSNKLVLKSPVIYPGDLLKNSDDMTDMSFTSEPEWKAWKENADKSRKKRISTDDSRRSESSKSKNSTMSTKRSSSHQRVADAGDRSYSHSHTGSRRGSHKSRKGKSEGSSNGREKRSSESSHQSAHDRHNESKVSKSKSHRRHDVPAVGSPKSKSNRKRVETMKTQSKPSPTSSPSYSSDQDAFQNALLNLSNGSFFDDNDESEHQTSNSLRHLRDTLTRMNSAPKMGSMRSLTKMGSMRSLTSEPKMNSMRSFNDSVNSFAESEDQADKERKKKRRGKRENSGGSVRSEGKQRSRSADENRTSSKGRRGKRSDKSPTFLTRKNSSCTEGSGKQRKPSKSPRFHVKDMHGKASRSPGTPLTSKGSLRGNSSKSYHSSKSYRSLSSRDADPLLDFESGFEPAWDEKKIEDDTNNFDLLPWSEDAAPNGIPPTPAPKPFGAGELSASARWRSEPSPLLNAFSPRSDCDTEGARVPRFDSIPPSPAEDIPPPPPPPPPKPPTKSEKKLDFPLNFVEYQDVSPLTVASKKVVKLDAKLMAAISYLQEH